MSTKAKVVLSEVTSEGPCWYVGRIGFSLMNQNTAFQVMGKQKNNLLKPLSAKNLIDTPALPGGVLSKFKLHLSGVLLPLIPNIVLNEDFVDANRRDEKSSPPEPLAIPVHLVQEVRKALLQPPDGYAF